MEYCTEMRINNLLLPERILMTLTNIILNNRSQTTNVIVITQPFSIYMKFRNSEIDQWCSKSEMVKF